MYKTKNEIDVLSDVLLQKELKRSTREIAKSYGKPITCADVSRIFHGVFPKGKEKRIKLGLPPICQTCYRRIPRPVTINQLMNKPIQDMPTAILKLAFENRSEYGKP